VVAGVVRAGAHAYLGPRLGLATGVGDMMVMGFPAGGSCGATARSLEAVHAHVAAAGRQELVAVHRLTWGVARTRTLSCGRKRLVAETEVSSPIP
jgi:hypothetical protein